MSNVRFVCTRKSLVQFSPPQQQVAIAAGNFKHLHSSQHCMLLNSLSNFSASLEGYVDDRHAYHAAKHSKHSTSPSRTISEQGANLGGTVSRFTPHHHRKLTAGLNGEIVCKFSMQKWRRATAKQIFRIGECSPECSCINEASATMPLRGHCVHTITQTDPIDPLQKVGQH